MRKRTKIMGNSNEVLKRIAVKCPDASPDESQNHVHVPLEQGRAKRCQAYPRSLIRNMCSGIAAEKKLREMGMLALPLLDIGDLEHDMKNGAAAALVLHDYATMQAFQNQSGEALDPIFVRKARMEEMEYFRSMQIYEKVPIAESIEAIGRKPIAVIWVDINKGDSTNPNLPLKISGKGISRE